jgi:hypothetical protein
MTIERGNPGGPITIFLSGSEILLHRFDDESPDTLDLISLLLSQDLLLTDNKNGEEILYDTAWQRIYLPPKKWKEENILQDITEDNEEELAPF